MTSGLPLTIISMQKLFNWITSLTARNDEVKIFNFKIKLLSGHIFDIIAAIGQAKFII